MLNRIFHILAAGGTINLSGSENESRTVCRSDELAGILPRGLYQPHMAPAADHVVHYEHSVCRVACSYPWIGSNYGWSHSSAKRHRECFSFASSARQGANFGGTNLVSLL